MQNFENLSMQNQQTVLEVRDITKHFVHAEENLTTLDGISLDVSDGDFVCIVGPSGCGKSTFLRIVAGLEKHDSGQILLNGKAVSKDDQNMILVFQEGGLFPWLNVIDNVEFGLKMNNLKKAERSSIAKRYLEMMQLEKFATSFPHQLSTGMKQRVAIARALAMDPKILLMDEPFAALDQHTRELLLVELQQIWQKTGKTILFVTHNIDESVILGSRVIVFRKRPSKIKKEITIGYRRPRLAEDRNLVEYKRQILAELKDEVRN